MVDGLLWKRQNVEAELQFAAFNISVIGTPTAFALEVAAPRVECVVYSEVSIPASFIKFFSQWAIVAGLTGLNGFLLEINNGFRDWELFLSDFVFSS